MKIALDISSVVKHYAPRYQDLFSEEGYLHFQKALTGFMISEKKTLSGMNRIFKLEARHQSSFNRFFTTQPFDMGALEKRRLEMLQANGMTQFKTELQEAGALALDDSLLKHWGSHFENIYNLYDYVEGGYKPCHDLVTLHYCNEVTDYPVFYQLWEPPDWEVVGKYLMAQDVTINEAKWAERESKPTAFKDYMRARYKANWQKHPGVLLLYKNKLAIGNDLLSRFVEAYPALKYPVLLDSGFTSAYLCEKITDQHGMDYVGALRSDRNITQVGNVQASLGQFTETLKAQHFDEAYEGAVFHKTGVDYKGQRRHFYAYCKNHTVQGFSKKQRLVIAFDNEELNGTPYFLVTNQLSWKPSLILRLRRQRWPIETYHQEGKAEGLDKYQIRKLKGIQTHIALVVMAYSMLQCLSHAPELLSSLEQRLFTKTDGTLPFLRRLMQAEAFVILVEHILAQVAQGRCSADILAGLIPHIAHA